MKRVSEAGRERVRLETWGEIAQHLGVEIRTSQRWEDRLGLPVRRLEGSQAVFAFADELDSWRAGKEIVAKRPDAAPATITSIASVRPPDARRALIWPAILGPVAVAAFALGIGAAPRLFSPSAEPSTLAVHDSRVIAMTVDGRRAWWFDFGESVRTIDIGNRLELRDWWQRVDFDGDGADEIIAVIAHALPNSVFVDVLHCFTLDGRLRFSIRPDLTLTFKAGSYTGPWSFWDFEPIPEDKSIWLAFEHLPWWPSGILRIDASGQTSLRYVHPGSVNVLRTLRHGGKVMVLAGGVNNEYGSANLAVLDPAGPPASAPPRGDSGFNCIGCPPGMPQRYMLFSQTPLSKADDVPYNRVEVIMIHDGVRVETFETGTAGVIYELANDLTVLSATPTDGYWSWRPRLASWATDPQRGFSTLVQTWTAGTWTTTKIERSDPLPVTVP